MYLGFDPVEFIPGSTAGAAAATAILPNMLCNFASDLFIPDSCTTTRVILAFSWINTVNCE